MRIVLLCMLLIGQIFATMILNLNVKESPKSIELLLNFDVPFHGTILQKRTKNTINLILKDVKILAPWQKKLSSKIAYQIDVTPFGKDTRISIYTISHPKIYAARSKDGFSLKIILKSFKVTSIKQETSSSSLIKKILIGTIGLLVIGAFLFVLLRLLRPQKAQETKRTIIPPQQTDFRILFEKPLDERNKIALIEHRGIQYLVIIGSSNVLLGKYKEGEIETHEDFERAIESQNIAEAMRPKPEDEIFTTIEEYKKRASGNL